MQTQRNEFGVMLFLSLLTAALVALLTLPARGEMNRELAFDGDRFTYRDGELVVRGVLVKPDGPGPFPAILLSHGRGGSGERFGRGMGRAFVERGYLCIAPDYTHGDPQGDRRTFGASPENLRRAEACLDILAARADVDPRRLYAVGNSMGAFLTVGLAAAHPERLAAAAILAGGINHAGGFASPSAADARKIRTPMLLLHGGADTTVPPRCSAELEAVLRETGTPHERRVFDGAGHNLRPDVGDGLFQQITGWFERHPKAE